ncbi:hypothetical protein AMTR_s00149p00082440, partial [Amborella trichopoda]
MAESGRRIPQWTSKEDEFFIDIMVKEIKKGGDFKDAWQRMMKTMRDNFGELYDCERLKSKYKFFRNLYNNVNELRNISDFGWDEGKRMVTAERLQMNGQRNIIRLEKIFSGGSDLQDTGGQGADTSFDALYIAVPQVEPEVKEDIGSSPSVWTLFSGTKRRCSQAPTTQRRRRGKPTTKETIAAAMTVMAEIIRS